jgi:hypothetical protein
MAEEKNPLIPSKVKPNNSGRGGRVFRGSRPQQSSNTSTAGRTSNQHPKDRGLGRGQGNHARQPKQPSHASFNPHNRNIHKQHSHPDDRTPTSIAPNDKRRGFALSHTLYQKEEITLSIPHEEGSQPSSSTLQKWWVRVSGKLYFGHHNCDPNESYYHFYVEL